MKIKTLFFGITTDLIGASQLDIDINEKTYEVAAILLPNKTGPNVSTIQYIEKAVITRLFAVIRQILFKLESTAEISKSAKKNKNVIAIADILEALSTKPVICSLTKSPVAGIKF